MLVDLRSDTFTRPTPAMRQGMFAAEVGDDVYGEDPTVNALESEAAELLGHEAALFTPSGIMANQIGIQLLVGPGEELVADAGAHIVSHEAGAAAVNGGIQTRTWSASAGRLDAAAVRQFARVDVGAHTVETAAIAVENTHNRGGGTVQPIAQLRQLREFADRTGIGLHCDGARLWNAHVASGVALPEYGRLFDTVSVCLSKGLGAPVGSLLVSTRERIARARRLRTRLGGAMRQAGLLAAAGRYALRHHVERLSQDHVRAKRLAEALSGFGITDPSQVETNIVLLRVPEIAAFASAAAEQGVGVSVMGPDQGRLLTHLDVNDDGLDHAIKVFNKLLS